MQKGVHCWLLKLTIVISEATVDWVIDTFMKQYHYTGIEEAVNIFPLSRAKILQKIAVNIATYVARGSPYTRRSRLICGPAHQVSELAAKMLKREQQPTFRWKRTRRQINISKDC